MRLHLIGLPHTKSNPDFNSCAYTAKLYKFLKMFPDSYHYANEGSLGDNLIQIFSDQELNSYFGESLCWQNREYFKVSFDHTLPFWKNFNERVIEEIRKRIQPEDLILIIAGTAQKQIADAFPENLCVEFGIGYYGVFSKYLVFESHAWQNFIYGNRGIHDGQFYHAVIPNYFDVADFKKISPVTHEDDYLLFMGRNIPRKGIEIVREIAKRHRVITMGTEKIDGLEYGGYANAHLRNVMMAKAKAVLVPTLYIPPFEGVNVEAQMCGTPVITTDFGAFTETVVHGMTGFRCRSLQEFLDAIDKVDFLDRKAIRKRAISLYSLEAVKPLYERYFKHLQSLFGNGWYQID